MTRTNPADGVEYVNVFKIATSATTAATAATVFFDGGSRGNPGRAGAGAVLYSGAGRTQADEVSTAVVPLGKGTNNQVGNLHSLKFLDKPCKIILMFEQLCLAADRGLL
jgi:hypothetical protein